MDDIQVGGLSTYVEDETAVFEFDGKVTSTEPLLTDAQDFAGAINSICMDMPSNIVVSSDLKSVAYDLGNKGYNLEIEWDGDNIKSMRKTEVTD